MVVMSLGFTEASPIHIKSVPSGEGTPQVLFPMVVVWVNCQPVGVPELKSSSNAIDPPVVPKALKVVQSPQVISSGVAKASRLHCACVCVGQANKTANSALARLIFLFNGKVFEFEILKRANAFQF